MHEWPLLIFTLFIQASIGLTIVSIFCLKLVNSTLERKLNKKVFFPIMLSSCILVSLGISASLFHLGYPANAANAIRNIGSSWLSREGILTGMYLGLLLLVAVQLYIYKALNLLLLTFAAIIGLVVIYCMASVYYESAIITWKQINTYFTHYGAMMTLGCSLSLLLIFLPNAKIIDNAAALKLITIISAIVTISVLARLLEQPAYANAVIEHVNASDVVTFPFRPETGYFQTAALRMTAWIFHLTSIVLIVSALSFGRQQLLFTHRKRLFAASIITIVAEVMLRYSFFSLS